MAAPIFPAQDSDSLLHDESYQKYLRLVSTLPKERGWITEHIHLYQGFWFATDILQGVITLQQQQYLKLAQPSSTTSDVLLVSYPKSGTTWLKALLFTIMNRTRYDFHTHPLLTSNPHQCVPFLDLYAKDNPKNPIPDVPLMATHIPYSSLPESIFSASAAGHHHCRMVYVFRDPKDVLVSQWHFAGRHKRSERVKPLPLQEAFELFSRGDSPYGSFWDHVLGYWKASLECPDRVLFLKYEDMKSEPLVHVKRLAEFIGQPFSLEEENEGVVHKITDLCSFENLSNLEVNKTGSHSSRNSVTTFANNTYFRQGKAGDSKNYLTAEMIQHLDQITKHKFNGFDFI
uniref:Sulfotransferase n=1 Tax=Davidia involucrata TaxID=16924 RepID=A0A5B6ZCY8_DAVIN